MNDTTAAPCAVLFPGQGSQEQNMGRDVAEASREAMDLWKKAEAICGAELREIYWDGDEAAMAETRYLQPALTVVNVSLWMQAAGALKKRAPLFVAGHSLGEFSALAAAEVLPLDKILELVVLRGRLMADADPHGTGAMAALLKLDLGQVQEIVDQAAAQSGELLIVANHNSPAQYVISGHHEAVQAAEPLVKEHKGRLVRLAVSGAFHSPMMQEAADELASAMKPLPWRDARHPVYLNTCAAPVQAADELQREMAKQMTSPVRWIEIIARQWGDGAREFVEVGPKNVLTKLLKANLSGKEETWDASSAGSLEQIRQRDTE